MKRRLVFLVVFSILISCSKDKGNFVGIGDFSLGRDFAELGDSKVFTSVIPEEHFVQDMIISKEIGTVSNLNVTTDKGKISEVRFIQNDGTNLGAIDNICKNLVKIELPAGMESHSFYTTPDESIVFLVTRDVKRLRSKSYDEFRYFTKEAAEKNFNIRRGQFKTSP